MEVGIDVIDISEFYQDIVSKRKILNKIFTKTEIHNCEKKVNAAQHYSVRFAGKEAVVKAFSCYGVKIPLKKIEILNKKNGIPFVSILEKDINNFEIKISLSHSDKTAVAFAFVYKKSEN